METSPLFDLQGKTALVTGGGRGIGAWAAAGLAEAGADVFVASRKLDNCSAVAEELAGRTGRRVEALECNLVEEGAPAALVDEVIARSGRLDVLVNSAGMVWSAPTLDYPEQGWDRVFALNVKALWLVSQAAARHMVGAGVGSIINISSISAMRGSREVIQPVLAYNASKGAVESLTRDLAVKLADKGVRVNSIAPGPFATDMMRYLDDSPELKQQFTDTIPLGRLGGEADIKGVVVFLASEAAAFVTGSTLVVDGGMLAVDAFPAPRA
jgi:NAD(P)-dependent dehydrogenase (short-subunit alcohol dehydrogenase family)